MSFNKIIQMSLQDDQLCKTWEGKSKDFGRNFCIATLSQYTYLLYCDGEFVGMFKNGMPIYPFSENPQKKPSFFQRKKICQATVVCIASGCCFQEYWGTDSPWLIADDETREFCAVQAYGSVYFEIGSSSDDVLNFYKTFGQFGSGYVNQRDVLNKFKSVLVSELGNFFNMALAENGISLGAQLTPAEQLKLSKSMYRNVKNMFHRYGIYMNSCTEASLLSGVVIKKP